MRNDESRRTLPREFANATVVTVAEVRLAWLVWCCGLVVCYVVVAASGMLFASKTFRFFFSHARKFIVKMLPLQLSVCFADVC